MRGRLFLGLAILVTMITTGCGGGSMTKRVVAAGELAVSPSTLDFGQVDVGKVKHQTGTLTAGDSSITVTSADWSGTDIRSAELFSRLPCAPAKASLLR